MTVYKFSWQQHPLSAIQMMDKYFLLVWLLTWGQVWLAKHFSCLISVSCSQPGVAGGDEAPSPREAVPGAASWSG